MEDYLDKISREIRLDILKMYYIAGWGHLSSALSCVDIIVNICFCRIFNIHEIGNDHLVLSKGHGCATLYAVYARMGLLNRDELKTFYQNGSRLVGLLNPEVMEIGIPAGSLGHGICFSTGVAMADKLDSNGKYTIVLLGDGEEQEGSVWEAIQFAAIKKLSNLIVVVDCNGLQASEYVNELGSVRHREKWEAFGWNVIDVDGHNHCELTNSFTSSKNNDKPSVILAQTIKGKGIPYIENKSDWHSRVPQGAEWDEVCVELGINQHDLEYL